MSDLFLNTDLRPSDNAVLANIAAEPIDQMPEDSVNAGAASQIFMNDDPGIEMSDQKVRQDSHKVALTDRHLGYADPEPGSDRCELGRMTVSSYHEVKCRSR